MKDKRSVSSVKSFLLATGFPFEMYAAKILKENGYKVKIGPHFLDLEENKMREIDLIATKKIGKVEAVLIIECKQSNRDSWIFVAPENNPPLFWNYVKYLPELENFENREKCFSHLHTFDESITLANNYITYDGKKKSDSSAINEAVKKIIKGTISEMANYESNDHGQERALFFSVVFFSGEMFSATYNKSLKVKAERHLQFKDVFNSAAYEPTEEEASTEQIYREHPAFISFTQRWQTERKQKKIRLNKKQYAELKPNFIIDIVRKNYIKKYLKIIENGIAKIPVKNWVAKKEEENPLLF